MNSLMLSSKTTSSGNLNSVKIEPCSKFKNQRKNIFINQLRNYHFLYIVLYFVHFYQVLEFLLAAKSTSLLMLDLFLKFM